MAYTVKRHIFKDGKVILEDRNAYANGEFVSLDDFEIAMQKKNDEIADLIKKLRESKDYNNQIKHELEKKCSFETDRLVKLPFDPLETANMLINATYRRKANGIDRFRGCEEDTIETDMYSVNDLEQIAEHLLVYCKHNRESEE